MALFLVFCQFFDTFVCKFKIIERKLCISDLRRHFKKSKTIETHDVYGFYDNIEKGINKATVGWRIYELVRQGVLNRTGRGVYKLGATLQFIPEISKRLSRINGLISKKFPYVSYLLIG